MIPEIDCPDKSKTMIKNKNNVNLKPFKTP